MFKVYRSGDLDKDGIGLSKYDYNELISNCHIIFHCAALIDFNARFDKAI